MLPCCALGAFFLIQFMAFLRWFKKVILRKPIEENETDYWVPERIPVKDRLKSILSDRRRMRIAGLALTAEIAIFITVYVFDGFHIIKMGYTAITENAPATLKYFYQYFFEN